MANVLTFFSEDLPKRLADEPGLAAKIAAVFQFDIVGFGCWTVDLRSAGVVTQGPSPDPDCVIECSAETLGALLNNPGRAMEFFMGGQLKLSNLSLGVKHLSSLLG